MCIDDGRVVSNFVAQVFASPFWDIIDLLFLLVLLITLNLSRR